MEMRHQFTSSASKLKQSGLVALSILSCSTLLTFGTEVTASPKPVLNFASEHQSTTVVAQRNRRLIFRLSDRGVPVSRVGGAARGGCSTNTPHLQLTALTPTTNSGNKSALVETVSAYPTFFVYLPDTSAEGAEFILSDAKTNKELFHENLELKQSGGVVQIQLPEDRVAALEVGRQYHWSFTLLCDPDDASANLFVEGVVQRVQPSATLASQLNSAPLYDKVFIYAENGYWFESLRALATMREQNPQDPSIMTDWADLLTAGKLEILAKEPLLKDWSEVESN